MSTQSRTIAFSLCLTLTLFALAGCERSPADPAAQDPDLSANARKAEDRGEFNLRYRMDPTLSVSGSFRPGAVLTIEGGALVRSAATSAAVELSVLDAEQVAVSSGTGTRATSGVLSAGSRLTGLGGTVRFQEPGYYRVLLRTESRALDPALEQVSGVRYVDHSIATVWVLILPQGGKASRIWDSTVASSRPGWYLKYGSYGPFVPAVQTPTVNATFTGTVRYHDLALPGQPLVPLANALVEVFCSGVSVPDRRTDANGAFSVTLNTSQCRNDPKIIAYTSDASSNVLGRLGTSVSNSMFLSGFIDFRIANDYAARVFDRLREYAPIASQRFARNRGIISVWANSIDTLATATPTPTYNIYYSSSQDRIYTNLMAIFGEFGEFTTTHEYGHAFHHKAIEAPASYFCSDTGHFIDVAYTQSCAIVEGYADFFSQWLQDGRLSFWDQTIEDNPYRSNGDGAKIEATVAAFLNDMVDSPADSNGPGNTAGSDDENITWPGSYISDLIAKCTTTFAGATLSAIDGIDQLIYCAEHSISGPRAANTLYPNTFRALTTFTETATEPPGWSAATIRSLWKYNLYNQGTLP